MSLWFDLRILVDTAKSVVRRPRSVTAAAPGKAAPAARPFAALNQ